VDPVFVRDAFRRAKIEHYMTRADELVDMARYHAALRTLETIFGLDPNNTEGSSLQKRIELSLAELAGRNNGANHAGSNGTEVHNGRRRHELILMVDQDERILVSLSKALRKSGYESIGAASYDEAIQALSIVTPDLVISEVNFENGPIGYDLFLWIRTNTQTHDIPFQFLATRIDRETLIAGKRLGVDDFVAKPLDEDVVIASIKSIFARRKERNLAKVI
jgi:PleD family two-component response regulator